MSPILLQDGITPLSKWLLKLYMFSPTLSTQEKKLQKTFTFSKSNCGACICDTKIEMERHIGNVCY